MKETEAVSLSLWTKVGSRYEPANLNGISHFLEHMAFKGTKTRNAQQIAEAFDSIGGMFNAATGREYTTYYAKVLKEHFRQAADIIADITLNSLFDQEELDRERGVILQEIAMTNDTPDDVLFEHYQEIAFPEQAIGRSILGPPEHIQNFTRQNFVDYVGKYYTAPNMVLAVAGNIEHQQVMDFAQQAFASLSSTPAEPAEKARYNGGVKLIQKDLEQVHIALGWQGSGYLSEDIYRLQLLAAILGGSMSSRLFQEIREKRGLAYHVSTFTSNYCDTGLFSAYAGCAPEKVDELLPVVFEQLHKATTTLKEEELERAKNQVKAALLMGYESSNFCADELGRHLMCFGRVIEYKEIIEKLEQLSLQDLQDALLGIVSQSEISLCAIGNIKALPDINSLTQPLKDCA
jgi:predicted Zn-dependent peptidase